MKLGGGLISQSISIFNLPLFKLKSTGMIEKLLQVSIKEIECLIDKPDRSLLIK